MQRHCATGTRKGRVPCFGKNVRMGNLLMNISPYIHKWEAEKQNENKSDFHRKEKKDFHNEICQEFC